jgi:chromate reductase, NAD(P)H dehydrogenase (quinone)
MKLIAISGALRKTSTNTGLLRALKEVAAPNIEIEIATLHGIPLYDGDVEKESGKPQSVKDLDARIRAADGVIIATPEYNFSVPGVLKNASDWLSRGGSPFKWKRVGVMGSADGPLGTGRSQYHLRQNLQALEAITMPKPEIFVGNASTKFDAHGNLTDEDTKQRLKTWLHSFTEWVEKKP